MSYKKNTDILNDSPGDYWLQVSKYLMKHEPKFFRYHIHGDIPDQNYLKEMINTAVAFPNINFLAFTKKYNMFNFLQDI